MKIPVLLPNIFNYPFTYDSDVNLQAGSYVIVPFGKFKMISQNGTVVSIRTRFVFWTSDGRF